jgi:hypothetical protein
MVGLQNGISYAVAAVAVDKFGNVGEISNIAYATPISTIPNSTAPSSTIHYGGQDCACNLTGQHGRPRVFARAMGIGLLASRIRRRGGIRRW